MASALPHKHQPAPITLLRSQLVFPHLPQHALLPLPFQLPALPPTPPSPNHLTQAVSPPTPDHIAPSLHLHSPITNQTSPYFSNQALTLKPTSSLTNSPDHFEIHNLYCLPTLPPTICYRFSSTLHPAMRTLAAGFSHPPKGFSLSFPNFHYPPPSPANQPPASVLTHTASSQSTAPHHPTTNSPHKKSPCTSSHQHASHSSFHTISPTSSYATTHPPLFYNNFL